MTRTTHIDYFQAHRSCSITGCLRIKGQGPYTSRCTIDDEQDAVRQFPAPFLVAASPTRCRGLKNYNIKPPLSRTKGATGKPSVIIVKKTSKYMRNIRMYSTLNYSSHGHRNETELRFICLFSFFTSLGQRHGAAVARTARSDMRTHTSIYATRSRQ